MRLTSAKILLTLLFVALTLGSAEASRSPAIDYFPQERGSVGDMPRVTTFTFRQTGGTDLMLDINGSHMPLPQVTSVGNRTYVVLHGISGEGAIKYEQGIIPMMTDVRARQSGRDFTITLVTDRPIEPWAVRGIPPSDTFTLHFKGSEEAGKLMDQRVATNQPRTARVPTGPFAVNTPITMDLRDTELRDVFRMFGEQVKKNIIIHESLPPVLVTMTFRNSPLSNVFGYLLKNYDLAYEFIDNDTILVGTATGLARISGKVETRSYRIAYADPAAVSSLLPNLTKITSANLVVDTRLRTLYATGTPDVLEEVAIALQRLDNPGRQVMIHARIMEFQDGDELEVQNTLNAIYDRWSFNYAEGSGRLGYRFNRALTPTTRSFDVDISAVERRSRTRTLANPSVIAIDGQKAEINLTHEVPYISSRDEANNPTWSTVEIGPKLVFTPRVGRDGIITLDIDINAADRGEDAVGALGERIPTAVKRQVITNVRVRNGEPFVVGGLFHESRTNNRFRIPIVGQLPLLGEIFTYRVREHRKTQVVMLVVPYILDTPDVGIEQERVMMRH